MADTLDLAGVIGTWVAVFLALVALLALLPAYVLYRRSRSQIAKALIKVDDTSQKFVSNVFVFGFLLRQTVRVPDLRNPPDPAILENAKLENKPTADVLGPKKSTTGWVEFAQIITATFPGVKYGDSSLLEFVDEQTSLPVHNTWLVALGILHRYSWREDYGLPIGAAIGASQDGAESSPLFSGLSGYINLIQSQETERPPELIRDRGEIFESIKMPKPIHITFKMHGLSSLHKSLKQDSLSFRVLAILFSGYIDGGDGQLFTGMVSYQYRSRRYDVFDSLKIARITEIKVADGALDVLPGVHVQATKKIGLVLTEIEGSHSRQSSPYDDTEPYHDGEVGKVIEEVLPSFGLYNLGSGDRDHVDGQVWMLRKDAYRFACAYLKQKPSPHGFLYDAWSDIVVSRILRSEDVGSILALAKTWLSKTDPTNETHKHIVEAVRNASEAILTWKHSMRLTEDRWSRRTMQAISSLDDAIDMKASQRLVTSQDKDIMWTAIQAIYTSNQDFRNDLKVLLEKLAAQDQQSPIVMLRIEEEKITLLEADGVEIGYSFDFRHAFPEAALNGWSFHNKTMLLIDTVLASLQGQLRAFAWSMALEPRYLKKWKRHTCDTSFVEAYVPQSPGTEIWLDSTTRESTTSSPRIRDQYADLDVALADIRQKYPNRRSSSPRTRDQYADTDVAMADIRHKYPNRRSSFDLEENSIRRRAGSDPRYSEEDDSLPPSRDRRRQVRVVKKLADAVYLMQSLEPSRT